MLDLQTLKAEDLKGLSKNAMADLAGEMLAHLTAMSAQLQARDKQAAEHIQEMKFKDAKLERITFELARLKAQHGFVLLWDAHSIRSEIPWLFEGRLPDLSIGTANGASADARIAQAALQACAAHPTVSSVLNGRFKGGYITRHYGQPHNGVHAIQLEMCQNLYMQEAPPFHYAEARAATIQPVLKEMVASSLAACRSCYEK